VARGPLRFAGLRESNDRSVTLWLGRVLTLHVGAGRFSLAIRELLLACALSRRLLS
jgi:hypothetical protein